MFQLRLLDINDRKSTWKRELGDNDAFNIFFIFPLLQNFVSPHLGLLIYSYTYIREPKKLLLLKLQSSYHPGTSGERDSANHVQELFAN